MGYTSLILLRNPRINFQIGFHPSNQICLDAKPRKLNQDFLLVTHLGSCDV